MHAKYIDLLFCSTCNSTYKLSNIVSEENGEIKEGIVSCLCNNVIHIKEGIPRFIDDIDETVKLETIKKFGYEWTTFHDYNVDNFFRWLPENIGKDFFKGKRGLDAGCGAGRHLKTALDLGAEMVGVDISHAVDAAYKHNHPNDNMMIVQCDIYHIPIPINTFDFIYSLGVLMHLPDPEKGFNQLIDLLKPEGCLFVWVYQRTLRKVILEYFRVITKKLPNSLLHALATTCSILDYYILIGLYKFLKKFLPLDTVTPSHIKEYAKHTYRTCQTDWFDRLSAPISNFYNKEELHAWIDKSDKVKRYTIEADGDFGWKVFVEKA